MQHTLVDLEFHDIAQSNFKKVRTKSQNVNHPRLVLQLFFAQSTEAGC